jgi:hypothetical protein
LKTLLSELRNRGARQDDTSHRRLSALGRELRNLEAAQGNLLDAVEQGLVGGDSNSFRARYNENEARQEELIRQIAALDRELKAPLRQHLDDRKLAEFASARGVVPSMAAKETSRPEGRLRLMGTSGEEAEDRTRSRSILRANLARVNDAAKRSRQTRFTALMHHVDVEALRRARPDVLDFLGFTHYCGKTRDGRFLLCQKTQGKRMIRKLKELRREMRRWMHQRLRDQHAWLSSVLRGHYAYFGISGNSRALGRFRLQVMKAWRRVLLRRSQRPKLSWERFNGLLKVFPMPLGRVHGWRQQMA